MNISTERRGLGRGLGELFQRTEPRPRGGPACTITGGSAARTSACRFLLRRSSAWTPSRPILGNREPSSTKRR